MTESLQLCSSHGFDKIKDNPTRRISETVVAKHVWRQGKNMDDRGPFTILCVQSISPNQRSSTFVAMAKKPEFALDWRLKIGSNMAFYSA